jgi:hypothetical protein
MNIRDRQLSICPGFYVKQATSRTLGCFSAWRIDSYSAIGCDTSHGGGIVEMVIRRLPGADSECLHGLKYRLVYVKDGRRLVGYDNERGKGDHKPIGG